MDGYIELGEGIQKAGTTFLKELYFYQGEMLTSIVMKCVAM